MQEQLIDHIIRKYADFRSFEKLTTVSPRFSTYDLRYFEEVDGLR